MAKPKLLELFAGSRSVSKVAERLGADKFSVDWTGYEGVDLQIDVEMLGIDNVPFIPDVIWASPDCTTYSIAAISTHRNGTEPKSEYAKKCDKTNQHVLRLIQKWLKLNPNMVFFIENPRGMLRKMPFMQSLPRHTVWYCQYGDDRAKPTDIWTNSKQWKPRPECFNGNPACGHARAPRGSATGTQGRKNSYEKSRIPEQLVLDILASVNLD
jgi:site-specific DNA-cytosine methylase